MAELIRILIWFSTLFFTFHIGQKIIIGDLFGLNRRTVLTGFWSWPLHMLNSRLSLHSPVYFPVLITDSKHRDERIAWFSPCGHRGDMNIPVTHGLILTRHINVCFHAAQNEDAHHTQEVGKPFACDSSVKEHILYSLWLKADQPLTKPSAQVTFLTETLLPCYLSGLHDFYHKFSQSTGWSCLKRNSCQSYNI